MTKTGEFIWIADYPSGSCRGGGQIIEGVVQNDSGLPVTGAKVTVYQAIPGQIVTGTETDTAGNYSVKVAPGIYLVRITEPQTYDVDAALARPAGPGLIDPSILGLGMVSGMATARLGLGVQKSGRSTGVTRGKVTVVDATVVVGFGNNRRARFTGQIITAKMGEPGDSGSLLLDGGKRAIGLLFAGSSLATIYNPINRVLDSLDVDLSIGRRLEQVPAEEDLPDIRKLCKHSSPFLLSLPNVVGVGAGFKVSGGAETGKPCLTVLVEKKIGRNELGENELVPPFMEDVATDVVETGKLEAISPPKWYGKRLDRRAKMRPARPGVSIGHERVSAGTFGAVVYDRKTGEPLILSNNHVLANSTDGKDQLSAIGDAILQPGRHDGGNTPDDIIGTLLRFNPIAFL